MTSRNSIKFHNLLLPHIFTRKILTKNHNNQFSELCISEYDITEAFLPHQNFFSPKQIYFSISHHLYEILRRNTHIHPTTYSFSIYKNKNNDNYEILVKDISILAGPTDTIDTIHEKVNIIVSNMPETIFPIPMDSLTDYCLLFTKYEIFSNEEENINSENIFRSDVCQICGVNQPTVLFCNCGHLCICKECYENYNKKQCISCRMLNTSIRIL